MKIAQVAPLVESVPPRLYGGTERVVSYLTEELVRQGHEVTLFASGDSKTSARLVPCCKQALRLDPEVRDHLAYDVMMLESVKRMAPQFDILHFHTNLIHFPVFAGTDNVTLTTLHGRQDSLELKNFYDAFRGMPLVSISDAQRRPIPTANFARTVPHGLPKDLLPASLCAKGGYLAFVGRISPEKRVDRAIEIASAVGLPLKIAAKVDGADERYFREYIEPLLKAEVVEFIGEINEQQKAAFLGGARALLFPIDWPEPFGLVMIEAMACGTPVLAFRCGSVSEVIDEGVTGIAVDSVHQAVMAMDALVAMDRRRVRRRFEERFTAERMARDYLRLYETQLGTRQRKQSDFARPILLPAPKRSGAEQPISAASLRATLRP
jgi:glycosyltransferase involved in cell wall biosynthesis